MTTARLGFAFDLTSIPSLLAFLPACALADELNVEVEWLPVASLGKAQRSVPAGVAETAAQRHARVRADYFAKDNARYAKWQGVALRRTAEGVNSALASAGCLWASRHGVARAYLERVWLSFWANELNIECGASLAIALTEVGAPGFHDADLNAQLKAHEADVAARGVFAVPTFLLDGEMFVGRAHLPMIRSLLSGPSE